MSFSALVQPSGGNICLGLLRTKSTNEAMETAQTSSSLDLSSLVQSQHPMDNSQCRPAHLLEGYEPSALEETFGDVFGETSPRMLSPIGDVPLFRAQTLSIGGQFAVASRIASVARSASGGGDEQEAPHTPAVKHNHALLDAPLMVTAAATGRGKSLQNNFILTTAAAAHGTTTTTTVTAAATPTPASASASASASAPVSAPRLRTSGGKRKPQQDPEEAEEEEDEDEEEDMEQDDDEQTEDEEGDENAQKTAQRRSKRTPRPRASFKALNDDLDDDEIDAAISADKHRALTMLKAKLHTLSTELTITSKQSKTLPSTDRKKIRNRQASCVSRLKKKIMQVEMEIHVENQDHEIAELTRQLRERDALLERHGLMHFFTHRERRPERAGTPGSVSGEHAELAVVPVQPTPKRPRGRPRKHPRPEDIAVSHTNTAAVTGTNYTPIDVADVPASLLPPVGVFATAPSPARMLSLTPTTPSSFTSPLVAASLAALTASTSTALLRQVSVPNPVCLCHGEEEPDMISCQKCRRPYHRYCVGLSSGPLSFTCGKCK